MSGIPGEAVRDLTPARCRSAERFRVNRRDHWEQVYETRPTNRVGWYTPHLQRSIEWIDDLGLPPDAAIIDVGGGASTLVDDLLDGGFSAITVLDISRAAQQAARDRLGSRAGLVEWIRADITAAELRPGHFELWHDRAVFHFLTDAGDRQKYRDRLLTALKARGHLIIGTFSPEAPPKCSGLPVRRYSVSLLSDTLGADFGLIHSFECLYVTPGGEPRPYIYTLFRRTAGPRP